MVYRSVDLRGRLSNPSTAEWIKGLRQTIKVRQDSRTAEPDQGPRHKGRWLRGQLPQDQLDALVQRYNAGASLRQLARETGISKTSILSSLREQKSRE